MVQNADAKLKGKYFKQAVWKGTAAKGQGGRKNSFTSIRRVGR
jgi:hypothetical protein